MHWGICDAIHQGICVLASELVERYNLMDHYDGDRRFYDSAYDSNGNRLDTTIISRDVGACSAYGCSHEEHIGFNVSREYLEKAQGDGIQFKVSGKAGEMIYSLPSAYIKAFLSVVK